MLVMAVTLAQPVTPHRFKTISINEGLSQGFVSGIVQDKKGLMWFTTTDGLNKYDGYTCTVFHHNIEDTTSLGSDDLTCIFEDSKQQLWIGTRNSGLDLFDRATHSFTHFREGGLNNLRSNKVLDITEDKNGTLWVRTASGIDRLQTITDPKTQIPQYRFTSITTAQNTMGAAETIFIDSRNRVFICNTTQVLEYIPTNNTGEYKLVERFRFPSIVPFFVPLMLEDTLHHSLLLNTQDVIRFQDYNFHYPQYLYHSKRTEISWTIDKQNKLWVGGINEIVQIDLATADIRKIIPADPLQIKLISAPTLYYTDRTGVVWIGSGGYGLAQHDPEMEKFNHLLAGESMYQLLEYMPGKLLNNALYNIDVNQEPALIDSSFSRLLRNQTGLPSGFPLTLARDSSGNIWYGTPNKLVRVNPSTQKVTQIPVPYNDVSALPYPVYIDGNNNLWTGYKNWLLRYDIASGTFNRYAYPISQTVNDFEFLQNIYEDDGILWLGTVNGLFYFDLPKDQFGKPFLFNQQDSTSISSNFILSFCQDASTPGRYLWVGTKGGGLNRLDKFTGKFERYTSKNGLPNNVIYGIVPDHEQQLWLSTNKGISAFNTQTKTFRNFDVSDGLQDNEFNRYGYTPVHNGKIAFAGMNGITIFNPRDIQPLPSPRVILTELRLAHQLAKPLADKSPLLVDIDFTEELNLRYEQNVITFRFAAMDYRRHPGIRYRYKMEGFDKDWIYSGAINEATYTNLDAGEYHLMIQAAYGNDNWNAQPKILVIYVQAPWWQTWWFKMFVITGTVSVAYALYRYRIHQLTQLESLRNRIARDLHDEVGSSISTIAIYSRIMHEQMENKTFNNETLLQKISEHATEIMESMNDIIWNINTKNDAFENIINRMREHAFQLLEAKGYQLHFDFDENLYQMQLPMEKRRDLYLIYKEALNNIAKYAAGQNVWINMAVKNEGLYLFIKDDGKGFDLDDRGKSGNGVSNMQHRASMLGGKLQMISNPGAGTELHLNF